VRFVDTSFWIAFFLRHDAHHEESRALWAADRGALLTTNHVVGETWTFARRREGHRLAVRFVDAILSSPSMTVHRVDERAEQEAWRWLRRHDEREYSFVDATSFAVMRRLRIREALAFDGDFTAAGFTEARP
jgi:predicted nucleic acid-binding protein